MLTHINWKISESQIARIYLIKIHEALIFVMIPLDTLHNKENLSNTTNNNRNKDSNDVRKTVIAGLIEDNEHPTPKNRKHK